MNSGISSLGTYVRAGSLALLFSSTIAVTAPTLALAAAPEAAPAPAAPSNCDAHDGLHFICGPVASEDLIQVPGAPLLVASGMSPQGHGHLYLIDARSHKVETLFPNPAAAPVKPEDAQSCATPVDADHASFAGLSVRRDADGVTHLYAVNNARRSVEGFRFDAQTRQLQWESCVKLPEGGFPNGVIALPDGGLLATSFFDSSDKDSQVRMERGEPTGAVLEWHPGDAAFVPARNFPAVAGANGIEVSADGKTAYVSAWSAGKLLIVSRADGHVRELPLDFLPDNIHRLADGTLLVAGQRASVASLHHCGPDCPQPWEVTHVDPLHGTVDKLLAGSGDSLVNYSCGAVMVDGKLYFTARGADRLVYAPMERLRAASQAPQPRPGSTS
ncbi:SMP-30/gluconolactonase/LRE family protein [Paraburkholderia bannensis]|uniref:SMP-30/gluconolactonase/LRE family protein n=1 Tax=Paraburkholderia bannensis TaxID=765414 RepID=UPI002AC32057|nr:hypothetical protein [Paraburkholderia bannensis]